MKILITGSGGMVGRNIKEYLGQRHEILAPRRAELDLLSYEPLLEYLHQSRPDLIIHCAGRVGGIQANIRNPVAFLVENYDMGRNIVMGAREVGIRKLLNMGTSCMYPRDCVNPIKEDMILKGQLEPTNEGYALSKVAIARLCQYIVRENPEYMFKTVIPCNLYGTYDKFDAETSHMIPGVMRRLYEAVRSGQPAVDIWGDGTARREFMFAEDLANFVSFAIERFEAMPEIINCGLGYDYSINEYYREIAKVVGFKGEFSHDLSKPVGMKQKLVDITRLKEFGWTAPTSLQQGIQKTYEHMVNHVL